jgi:hypothetical protein
MVSWLESLPKTFGRSRQCKLSIVVDSFIQVSPGEDLFVCPKGSLFQSKKVRYKKIPLERFKRD